MSTLIAVSGKGGVGKTTLSALIVRQLIRHGKKPVLAVDADPNTCLDAALGITADKSVGSVREEARLLAGKSTLNGIAKQEMLQIKIEQSLIEANDFDFIAMGRSEGPGCYCYANNVLKATLNEIAESYPYIVLDNEAGMENLSRRIVRNVDLLAMIGDSSRRGLETIRRLHEVTHEMQITYGHVALIVNRVRNGGVPLVAKDIARDIGAVCTLGIAENNPVAEYLEQGKSLLDLPDDNEITKNVDELLIHARVIDK
ncbi:MAG: AAA family ATPase [Chitinivibrionales bacterium]|nr:AAA family ATPase [Chitinivibrionales bacterium]